MNITDAVALITGAGSGMGYAIATELLKHGAKGIAIIDICEEDGQESCRTLKNKYGNNRVIFIKTDITSDEQFTDAFKKTIETFGRLDIVVNNAGVMTDIQYYKCINTNLIGSTRGLVLALQFLGRDRGGNGGVVLNIASTMAVHLQHTCPVYAASKAGVLNLVRGFGHPLHSSRTGVCVLGLLPGPTYTPLFERVEFLPGCMEECAKEWLTRGLPQSPESVARAAIYVIKNGESGSLWIAENNKFDRLEEVDKMPNNVIMAKI